ncbi:MAG: ATP-binding cassette domain-containing protein [Dissulfurispiraceae bacterium]|jgi:Fe-S cluster assembly ATP-binding protein|nr:ATP-binding cassette domain-containing protein [Dissulfurispiraceae bacterium]
MLNLQNLCFSSDNRQIIDDLSFSFQKGKFYAITGPNGSGKTTLSKLIMGIHKSTSGRIIFDGQDITGYSVTERAKAGIAYAFQHPARFKGITLRDLLNIALGKDHKSDMRDIVEKIGICSFEFLDKQVDSKLSGGEIKKIEMATTIALNPKLVMYDEPDTGIDLWTIDPMVNLLKREQAEKGTTTIVISHNRTFLEAADTVILIKSGKIAYQGDTRGALPMLNDLSICNQNCKVHENDGCFR